MTSRRWLWLLSVAIAAGVGAAAPGSAYAARVAMGAYVPDYWQRPALLDAYAKRVGQMPTIILSYKRWDVKPFYRPELEQIDKRGAVPMVSWEPWNARGHGFRLSAIARGRYDRYVRRSAREAKEWGGPILLRFGQEMNGSWAPWEKSGKNGGGPSFIAAWRHIVRVFRQAGASNVRWVWCPNVNNGGLPFMQFYPGERWVDWVGLDGFNWGGSMGWRSFSEIFGRSYETLARKTSRPIVIAETGSGQTGGNKAAWVTSMLSRELPHFKRIRAVVWYDAIDRSDFRVNSSPAALQAFRRGIARPFYRGSRKELLSTPARLGRAVSPIRVPGGGFGELPLLERLWQKAHDKLGSAIWLVVGGLALVLMGGVVVATRLLLKRGHRAAMTAGGGDARWHR